MLRIPVIVVGLALLSGCDSGLRRVPVTGTITLDDKPLAYKSYMFLPEDGIAGHGGGGSTDGEGKYELIASVPGALEDERGVPPGRYRVIVFEPTIPITAELPPEQEGDEPVAAIGPYFGPRKKEIPAVYSSQETTPLMVEVPQEGGALDLKLSTRQ